MTINYRSDKSYLIQFGRKLHELHLTSKILLILDDQR